MAEWKVIQGDTIAGMATLPEASVHTCITSPPYWGLRDYGHDGQIGLESTPTEYVARMVEVFRAVRRVLRDDGTMWVNLGDSYAGGKTGRGDAGLKQKDLVGIPWRVAFALRDDGWYLRQDIVWNKPNPMPESVTDRCAKAHEYMFLLSKSAKYYFDAEAVMEPLAESSVARYAYGFNTMDMQRSGERPNTGEVLHAPAARNRRSVWTVPTQRFSGAHFAVFPEALVEPCVKAGCPLDGTVLDPFNGSGTTGVVALKQGRSYVGCELNPEYVAMSRQRLASIFPLMSREVAGVSNGL